MRTSETNGKFYHAAIEPGCTVHQLSEAERHVAASYSDPPASPKDIAKGLAVLTAVCAKPADFDDAKIVLWSERLKQVLQEVPAEIALAAIEGWPKTENGKWWPTENEMREQITRRLSLRGCILWAFRDAMADAEWRQAHAPTSSLDGFESEPIGATAAYCEEFRALDEGRYLSYLQSARFAADRIGLREAFAGDALERAAPGLLAKHGVRVVEPRAYRSDGTVEWMP